jgi:hypothetical protein
VHRLISFLGIRGPTDHPVPRDVRQECHKRRAGVLDHGKADQGPVRPAASPCRTNLLLTDSSRMGSTSTPAGAGGKSTTITPGQTMQQQQSSGCC